MHDLKYKMLQLFWPTFWQVSLNLSLPLIYNCTVEDLLSLRDDTISSRFCPIFWRMYGLFIGKTKRRKYFKKWNKMYLWIDSSELSIKKLIKVHSNKAYGKHTSSTVLCYYVTLLEANDPTSRQFFRTCAKMGMFSSIVGHKYSTDGSSPHLYS